MSKTAKICAITSEIKSFGTNFGSRQIFIKFGQPSSLAGTSGAGFVKAISAEQTGQIIREICQQKLHKGLYFCGAQPLLRFKWLEHLQKQTDFPFHMLINKIDTPALAKAFHLIDSIDLRLDFTRYQYNEQELKEFIILASFKNLALLVKPGRNMPNFFPGFLKNTNEQLPVFLYGEKREDNLSFYYEQFASFLTKASLVTQQNMEKFFEVKNENFNQQ